MKKSCFKCGKNKPKSDFYKHQGMADGHLNKCKECARTDVRDNRKARFEKYSSYEKSRYAENADRRKKLGERAADWREKNPDAYKAHYAVSNAVRDGRIIKKPCLFCDDRNVHAHHSDYSKPLDVVWVCARCHHRLHANFPAIAGHSVGQEGRT